MSLPPADDPSRRLVERIQAGDDPEAFAELYRLHHGRVFRFFGRLGFNGDESEDLTQDTFLRVHRRIESFKHDSRFERWLFVVATNVFRNEIRRRRTEKRGLAEVALDGDGTEVPTLETLASPAASPFDEALQRQRRGTLHAAIEELPAQMRRCVMLRVYHGLKYREIAGLMGISIESVKAHLHQAQLRLKGLGWGE